MAISERKEEVVEYDYNDPQKVKTAFINSGLYQDLSRFIIIETLPSSLAHIANFSLVNYNPDTETDSSKLYTDLIYSCTVALSKFIDYYVNTSGYKLVTVDNHRSNINYVLNAPDIKGFVTMYKKYRQALTDFDNEFNEWLDHRDTKVEFCYDKPGSFHISESYKGDKYTLKGVDKNK